MLDSPPKNNTTEYQNQPVETEIDSKRRRVIGFWLDVISDASAALFDFENMLYQMWQSIQEPNDSDPGQFARLQFRAMASMENLISLMTDALDKPGFGFDDLAKAVTGGDESLYTYIANDLERGMMESYDSEIASLRRDHPDIAAELEKIKNERFGIRRQEWQEFEHLLKHSFGLRSVQS